MTDPIADFEAMLARVFGNRLRAEGAYFGDRYDGETLGCRLYSSLTNMQWRNASGAVVGYSFRCAGGLIADLVGDGDYLDWYCSRREGQVDDEIRALLNGEGWTELPYVEEERRGDN
jgi:hypothetical protein